MHITKMSRMLGPMLLADQANTQMSYIYGSKSGKWPILGISQNKDTGFVAVVVAACGNLNKKYARKIEDMLFFNLKESEIHRIPKCQQGWLLLVREKMRSASGQGLSWFSEAHDYANKPSWPNLLSPQPIKRPSANWKREWVLPMSRSKK